jgi:putative MATE family efflux protein
MNEQKTNPLGTEKISSLLLRFAIPSIIAMVVSALYNMVDQFFIGRSVGMLGNAATNVAFPLVITCTAIALMCGIGGAANFNLCMGQQEKEEAASFAGNAITMLFSLGVILCIITRLFLKPMMILFGATSSVLDYSLIYTGITSLGFPFLILTTGGTNLVRADGSPKFSMTCTLTGAIINTILDPTLIFGFHMGIAGAAWATVIGQVVSGIMVILYLRKFKTVKLTKEKLRPHPYYIGRIVSLGMAPFFNQVSMMVVQIVMNNVLIRYGAKSSYGSDIPLACAGENGVAAYGTIMYVSFVFVSIFLGYSIGSAPLISYNYGARKLDRVREAYLKAAISATIISTVSFICFQLFPRQIIGIFGSESEAYFRFAEKFFRIFLFCTFINGLQPITANFFTAIGKANRGIFLSLTRQVIFLLPLMIILPIFFGIEGVMFSAPIADGFAAVCAITFAVKELRSFQKF